MNTQRILILVIAAVAAGAVAFLARGLLGGGTPQVKAEVPQIVTTDVLVASDNMQPGTPLDGTKVHWQKWPRSNVDASFITSETAPNIDAAVKGTIVRSPLTAGQPISNTAIVHADAASFMAATLTPGMRALSIAISTDTGAGGFILPNDHVDVVQTIKLAESPPRFKSSTILENIRVLAMDQTFKEDKDQKVVLAKTATLELSPDQAELIAKSQASGTLSLALRALGDSDPGQQKIASNGRAKPRGVTEVGQIAVIRYGVDHAVNGN
ncbi:MAG TPA: Flp pilus assembly protein CpaB [Rhizomicrobium sp.]|jgi:pilus assembly protein CpaB